MKVPITCHEDASTRWGPVSSRSWRPAIRAARSVFRHRPAFARSASARSHRGLAEAEIGADRRERLGRTRLTRHAKWGQSVKNTAIQDLTPGLRLARNSAAVSMRMSYLSAETK